MPLPKRLVEPVLVSRGTIPDDYPLPSELEAATNGTLANTVRQLSSLSRHADDLFGELAREATNIADRTNSLQARVDRLAVKVTQLDSTEEKISLQDIHMRKAFKSAVVFDQQIFSRATMPTAMLETYKTCDKPPPLDKLNCYRDDGKDGLKFYTDANYFFELWRQETIQETERVMHDKGKKPHRVRENREAGGGRHKKRVRQPHNTRERQRQIAVGHGEHIMPQNVQYRTGQSVINCNYTIDPLQPPPGMVLTESRPPRPSSIELRRSYPAQEVTDGINPQQTYEYGQGPLSSESLYSQSATYTPTRRVRPTQPPPAPPGSGTPTPSGSVNGTPTRGRSMSVCRETLPPPPPPPEAVSSPPPPASGAIAAHILARSNSNSRSGSPLHHAMSPSPSRSKTPDMLNKHQDLPPPPPIPQESPPKIISSPPLVAPPPPPPPPPLPMESNGPVNGIVTSPTPVTSPIQQQQPVINGDAMNPLNALKIMGCTPPKLTPPKDRIQKPLPAPIADPRNDLLKAIRDGIKLRKVEKIEQKDAERTNALHDVASILARRVAVEYSDSDSASESEYDSDGWAEQEPSA